MKTRIITAAICIPVLLFLLLVAPEIIVTVIFGVLMAIGAYEFLYRTGLVRRPRMVAYSALAAFMLSIWSYYGGLTSFLMLGLILFFMLLFSEVMMDHVKVPIELVGLCTLGGFLIPFLLSALIRILMGTNGRYFILLPFTIAFLSDAGAYFVGLRLGRHKLAPIVSPHKTVEGAVGGVLGSMAAGCVLTLVYSLLSAKYNVISIQVQPKHYLVLLGMGAVASVLGILGDLFASSVKRQVGIKDYGTIFPGHGGILDRFDSVMFIAPFVSIAVRYFFYLL